MDKVGCEMNTNPVKTMFQMEEEAALGRFAAISSERRRVLDSICEPGTTSAEDQESAERCEEYFWKEAAGLTPADANVLWHQMMTSAFDVDSAPQGMNLQTFFAESAVMKPANELEEQYVLWRRDFNQRGKLEQLAADAATVRRENRNLIGEVYVKQDTIKEMANGSLVFLTRLRQQMTNDETNLFLALMAPVAGKDWGKLSYEEIGKSLGGITKQAISARVKKFQIKHQVAWAFVEEIRRRRPEMTAFSALSPADRQKLGIDKAYGDERSD